MEGVLVPAARAAQNLAARAAVVPPPHHREPGHYDLHYAILIKGITTHFWPQIMHAGASVSGTQYGCTLPSSSCSELSPASTDKASPVAAATPWGSKNI